MVYLQPAADNTAAEDGLGTIDGSSDVLSNYVVPGESAEEIKTAKLSLSTAKELMQSFKGMTDGS